MNNEEIKSQCEHEYQVIKIAEENLKRLREICDHSKTFIGNYSYRVGVIQEATICFYCGTCLKIHG